MNHLKRIITVLTALLLILSAQTTVFADDLINNRHEDLTLLNSLAIVNRVSGEDTAIAFQQYPPLGILLCDAAEIADMTAFVKQCMANGTVPTVKVNTADEVTAVVDALTAASCKDMTVISEDATLLKTVRNRKTLVRTGLIIAPESKTLTSKEAADIRKAVRSAPATFCVIENGVYSRQMVCELQALAVAVWIAADEPSDVAAAITAGANGIITDPFINVAGFINEWFEDNTITRMPVLIGHRGNPTQAPENSLSGYLLAYENGADVIETDVEITKDGEVIIMHDNTLNRTTDYDGTATVNDMTLAQIKKYHLLDKRGNVTDEEVPTLRELLEAFRDKDCRIFVEFKGSNPKNVPAASAIIKELDMEDRVDVISFSGDFLKSTHAEMEGMSTGYLLSPVGRSDTPEDALNTLFYSLVLPQGANSTINPNKSVASAFYFQAATDRGLTVWPWTYGLTSNDRIFQMCPDGITTDDVQWFKDMAKSFDADRSKVSGVKGQELKINLSATCFGNTVTSPSADTLTLTVVEGDDCITLENGVLKTTRIGKATVIVGYKTATTTNTPYILYTEPITVTVHAIPLILWYVGGAVTAAAVIGLLKLRKKR